MSDSRTDQMLSLIHEAHTIAEQLRLELPRGLEHHALWAVIRLTQAEQSASELREQLCQKL